MTRTRIWVAGPRAWENPAPIEVILKKLVANYGIGRLLLMTGGAPGVDMLTEKAANRMGIHVFACRACWPIGRAAGPIRNGIIAQEFKPDVLIALHYMPLDLTNHPGTQSAIKQARKRGIATKILHIKPEIAIPSAHSPESPMGNRARAERGLPNKPPKKRRRKA